MEQHDGSSGSITTMLIGFVTALSNHFFGWFNASFLKINASFNIDKWFEALLTGMIGATGAYLANRFWKFLEKRKHKQNGS